MKNSPRLRPDAPTLRGGSRQDADRKGGGPRYLFLILIVLFQVSGSLAQSKAPRASAGVRVPFVGCASDGQVGPLEAPRQDDPDVPISTSLAQRLAYYQAEQAPGILAPRGWHCFGVYGSNGGQLFVSPFPSTSADFFSDKLNGRDGPAIHVTLMSGSTSGRVSVARVIARVFPGQKAFVQGVIDEHLWPASDFPFGPYPKDRLTYRGEGVVEYQTPANTDGLGTMSWLNANSSPIDGVEILNTNPDEDRDLVSLAMRLPHDMNDLTSAIIQQLERENAPLPPPKDSPLKVTKSPANR